MTERVCVVTASIKELLKLIISITKVFFGTLALNQGIIEGLSRQPQQERN